MKDREVKQLNTLYKVTEFEDALLPGVNYGAVPTAYIYLVSDTLRIVGDVIHVQGTGPEYFRATFFPVNTPDPYEGEDYSELVENTQKGIDWVIGETEKGLETHFSSVFSRQD